MTDETRCDHILEVEQWARASIKGFVPHGPHGILGPAPGCGETGHVYDVVAFDAHRARTLAIMQFVLEEIDCAYYGLERFPPELPSHWLPEAERTLAAFQRRWQTSIRAQDAHGGESLDATVERSDGGTTPA